MSDFVDIGTQDGQGNKTYTITGKGKLPADKRELLRQELKKLLEKYGLKSEPDKS